MDKSRVKIIAKRFEGLAMGIIGVILFSIGTSYYQDRFIYRIPIILSPIFDMFSNVGAASGMLVMGIGFIVWGFFMWKSTNVKKYLYWLITMISLVIGIFLANYEFESSEEFYQRLDNKRQKQIEEISKTNRPDLKNEKVIKFFDEFDVMYAELEANANAENLQEYYDKFSQWSAKSTDILKELDNDSKYKFSQYYTKLAIQWDEKIRFVNKKYIDKN